MCSIRRAQNTVSIDRNHCPMNLHICYLFLHRLANYSLNQNGWADKPNQDTEHKKEWLCIKITVSVGKNSLDGRDSSILSSVLSILSVLFFSFEFLLNWFISCARFSFRIPTSPIVHSVSCMCSRCNPLHSLPHLPFGSIFVHWMHHWIFDANEMHQN